jgi:hypothetical protein
MISVDVSKLTKDYAVVNGEKIMFDEPFEETPSREDFEKWLTNISNVLEATNVVEGKGDRAKV